jgi:hypothetical protein
MFESYVYNAAGVKMRRNRAKALAISAVARRVAEPSRHRCRKYAAGVVVAT